MYRKASCSVHHTPERAKANGRHKRRTIGVNLHPRCALDESNRVSLLPRIYNLIYNMYKIDAYARRVYFFSFVRTVSDGFHHHHHHHQWTKIIWWRCLVAAFRLAPNAIYARIDWVYIVVYFLLIFCWVSGYFFVIVAHAPTVSTISHIGHRHHQRTSKCREYSC